jgi:hypothetical protein
MDRKERLAAAKPTFTVKMDPLLGYYGVATIAGRTVYSTSYFRTEDEARAALYNRPRN